MKSLFDNSRNHLECVGLGYFGHLAVAFRIGGSMIAAGAACLAHGIAPALFQDKASRTVRKLHEEIDSRPHTAQSHRNVCVPEFEI